MQAPGHYLCGCNIEEKRNYCHHTLPTSPGEEPQYTSNRFDVEGFQVCPEHGDRMWGWASMTRSRERPIINMSDREKERRLKLGKPVPVQKLVKPNFNNEIDKRDARDPLEMVPVVQAALAEIRAPKNGHGNAHRT